MTTDSAVHYDRVFVIMRVDASPRREQAPETAVALLKALWSETAAEAEVVRLNQPNRERGTLYFWKATRLERRLAPTGTS
jgi:hypothetical protein